MPNEAELLIAHMALDQRFITPEQFGKCLKEVIRVEQLGGHIALPDMIVKREYMTEGQLSTLESLRAERGDERLVDGYEITGILGQGAMGCVYHALQLSMARAVALKVLPHELARDKHYIDRFVREARSTARLNHVNIVQGFDVGESRGLNYFAMEYVEGQSVRDLLRERKRLEEMEVIEIVLQVGRALDHAWELGIVHRDIKPDNIMISTQGVVKLTDMGLAKPLDGDGDVTRTGMIVGTPNYMSPEQARGTKEIDTRSDMYSLGITTYQLLTGVLPFRDPSPTVVMTKHITTEVPSPRVKRPKLSEDISEIVRRMTAKMPIRRYQRPNELIADLEDLIEGTRLRPMRHDQATVRSDRYRFCYVPTEKEVYFVKIAVHNGAITVHQVAKCMDLQETLAEVGNVMLLDDLLVDQGYLSEKHRKKILEVQHSTKQKTPESYFGRIATKLGFVTKGQVKECLLQQKERQDGGDTIRIGDLMDERGYLTLKDKVKVLTEQGRIRQALENRRFGNIAIKYRFVSQEQLDISLREQKVQIDAGEKPERLGMLLVDQGALTESGLRAILRCQRRSEMTGEPIEELMSHAILPLNQHREPSGRMVPVVGELFDNVRLKGVEGENCVFCGHPVKPNVERCPACKKERA